MYIQNLRGELLALQEERQSLLDDKKKLEQELQQFSTSTFFIEALARERLSLYKAKEVVCLR